MRIRAKHSSGKNLIYHFSFRDRQLVLSENRKSSNKCFGDQLNSKSPLDQTHDGSCYMNTATVLVIFSGRNWLWKKNPMHQTILFICLFIPLSFFLPGLGLSFSSCWCFQMRGPGKFINEEMAQWSFKSLLFLTQHNEFFLAETDWHNLTQFKYVQSTQDQEKRFTNGNISLLMILNLNSFSKQYNYPNAAVTPHIQRYTQIILTWQTLTAIYSNTEQY